jgi:hypothetical protein
MTPGGFLQHWSGLKLLGFDPKYIHVTCPYDPGDDTEWMEDQLTKAAVEAGHDRGRRVKIGVLLPDSPMDVERPA